MSNHHLTPYDTGDRLEPHPWVQSRTVAMPGGLPRQTATDDYGRVDFDDDEGRTVLSVYVERAGNGYVLHISNLVDEALTVSGDTEAIVLGIEHQAGVAELIALAARGRQDFLDQAEYGDYSQDDQDAATLRWVTAHNAAVAVRRQQSHLNADQVLGGGDPR